MRVYVAIFILILMISANGVVFAGEEDGCQKKDVKAPLSPTSCADSKADKLAVTINSTKIVESVVEKKMAPYINRMTSAGREMTNEIRSQIRQSVLDRIIMEQLIDEKLAAKKIEVAEPEIQAKVEEIAKQERMSMEELVKALMEKGGMTLDEFKQQIRSGVGFEKLMEAEADGKIALATEDELKKYYEENIWRYKKPDQVRASHILIKTEGLDEAGVAEAKKKIDGILKQAKDGANFGELAKTHSEDPGLKSNGGEYVFARGQMVPEFEEAAFSLNEGKISDVVKTKYGYHIIKLSEKIPAITQSLEDVKSQISTALDRPKKRDFSKAYVENLKSEAKIIWPDESVATETKKKGKPEKAEGANP